MPPTPAAILTPPPRRVFRLPGKDTDSISQQAATVRVQAVPPPPAPCPFETPPPRSDATRGNSVDGHSTCGSMPTMPRVGERFQGFLLVEELGQGSFARVYRAKQEALAGRDVALKITLRATREPERLARLQHTNVVPVYSVHNAPPAQVICMPFLGRQTIADKIQGFRKSWYSGRLSTRKAMATRKGSTSLAGSSSSASTGRPGVFPSPAPKPTSSEGSGDLVGDVDAVLQILLQLAEGLDHAHQRGILHLDLKPANVLLADTGEAMLLDFNLSFDVADSSRELVGGTIPYMAPEQLLDLRSRGQGGVDARTDLYSLGVLAYEMLTGTSPFPASGRNLSNYDRLIELRKKGPPPLREANPDVSPAVESIIRKLLEPEPADRYQSAAELREDLERHLSDRPLKFAQDRSIPERLGKWRRRNPRALVAASITLVLALAAGSGGFAYHQYESRAVALAQQRAARTHEVLKKSRLDLAIGGEMVLSGPAVRKRGQNQALAILGEYGLPEDANWQERAEFRRIPQEERNAVAGDLGELLLLLAHSKWNEGRRLEDDGKKLVAMEVIRLNQLAEGCFGAAAPPFLTQQRSDILAALTGKQSETGLGEAKTARDHFLNGLALMQKSDFKSAIEPLRSAVAAEPAHAAAQFCLAQCLLQQGAYEAAVERFESASVLMPDDPRPHFYMGEAFNQGRKQPQAERAFSRCLQLDPEQGAAYRCRAAMRLIQGQYREAEEDADRALELNESPLQIYTLRARIREAKGDFKGAADDREAASRSEPQTELDYLRRGWSYLPKHPSKALADFRAAQKLNPNSLKALWKQIYVLTDFLHEDEAALEVANRARDLYPADQFVGIYRSILLARLGQREAAHAGAESVVKSTQDPKLIYRLASTYSLTSRTNPEDRVRAISLLKAAAVKGVLHLPSIENDPDLEPLRNTPEFEKLVTSIHELKS